MRCTDILIREHKLITRLLDELETLVAEASQQGAVEPGPTVALLNFFEHFSDKLHQEKEERALLPLLVSHKDGFDGPEVERLSREHAADRRRLNELRTNLLGAICGDPGCLGVFVTTARSYIAIQRKHLQHEEEHMIPLAARILSPDEDRMAVATFRRIEHESGTPFQPAALSLLSYLAEARAGARPS